MEEFKEKIEKSLLHKVDDHISLNKKLARIERAILDSRNFDLVSQSVDTQHPTVFFVPGDDISPTL